MTEAPTRPLLWTGNGWRPRETFLYLQNDRDWQAVQGFYEKLVCGEKSLQDLGLVSGEQILLGDDWSSALTSFQDSLSHGEEHIDPTHRRRTYKVLSTGGSEIYSDLLFEMCLSYCGRDFDGWANNTDLNSIERKLFTTLEKDLGLGRVTVVCAGRTDKGVSACAQVVSFYTWQRLSIRAVVRAFNQAAGGGLRVWWVGEVDRSFHATFSAQWRRYVYLFPFKQTTPSAAAASELDAEWVETLLAALVGKKLDYYAFARDTPAGKKCECTLKKCRVFKTAIETERDPSETRTRPKVDCLRFEIVGDRFLRRMVRVLVTTAIRESLPEGARYGGRDPLALLKLLELQNRLFTGPPAPVDGLCFAGVGYLSHEMCRGAADVS